MGRNKKSKHGGGGKGREDAEFDAFLQELAKATMTSGAARQEHHHRPAPAQALSLPLPRRAGHGTAITDAVEQLWGTMQQSAPPTTNTGASLDDMPPLEPLAGEAQGEEPVNDEMPAFEPLQAGTAESSSSEDETSYTEDAKNIRLQESLRRELVSSEDSAEDTRSPEQRELHRKLCQITLTSDEEVAYVTNIVNSRDENKLKELGGFEYLQKCLIYGKDFASAEGVPATLNVALADRSIAMFSMLTIGRSPVWVYFMDRTPEGKTPSKETTAPVPMYLYAHCKDLEEPLVGKLKIAARTIHTRAGIDDVRHVYRVLRDCCCGCAPRDLNNRIPVSSGDIERQLQREFDCGPLLQTIPGNKPGKKWVPNDFLQRQVELQRLYKAAYVVRSPLTMDGRPVARGEEFAEIPIDFPHFSAKAVLGEAFEKAVATGDRKAVLTLVQNIPDAHVATLGSDQFQVAREVIEAQLALEFDFIDVDTLRATAPAVFSDKKPKVRKAVQQRKDLAKRNNMKVTTRPALSCVSDAERDGRRFYPAAPLWIDKPRILYEALVREGHNATLQDVETAAYNLRGQRDADTMMYRISEVYRGLEQKPMTSAEHIKLLKRCGCRPTTRLPKDATFTRMDVMNRAVPFDDGMDVAAQGTLPKSDVVYPIRCQCCDAVIELLEDDDIGCPQCVCGEPYCSDECHKADWPGHRSTCEMMANTANSSTAGFGPSFDLTAWYWHLVFSGALPFPGHTDHVAAYQARYGKPGKRPPTVEEIEREMNYYMEFERTELANRVGVLQDANRKKPTKESFQALLEELLLQHYRMSAPLKADSPGRLRFKMLMCSVYANLANGLLHEQPSLAPVLIPVKSHDKIVAAVQASDRKLRLPRMPMIDPTLVKIIPS